MKLKALPILAAIGLVSIFVLNSCKKETGCTDSEAKNFNPAAVVDDESCVYYRIGCTDRNALNYDPLAEIGDNKCVYPEGYNLGDFSSGNTNTNSEYTNNNDNTNSSVPQQVQNALVFKYTGVNCSICGGWGGPTFKSLMDHSENIRGLAFHVGSGDPMYPSPYPWYFADNWPTGGGIPALYGMETKYPSSSTASSIADDIDLILAQSPLANTGFKTIFSADEVNVVGTAKFFSDAEAGVEYFVGIYLLENEIPGGANNVTEPDYEQLNGSADFHHEKVNRNFVAPFSIGSDFVAGDEIDFEETISIDSEWNADNLEVLTIIFKEDASGEIDIVNCN